MQKLSMQAITSLLEENIEDKSISLIDRLSKIEDKLSKHTLQKAVLGIDIYKYSKYENLPQMLIPYLFKNLYEATVKLCLDLEPYIFRNYTREKFISTFIDTGDGGFQIFDNPFEALTFGIFLQLSITRYNTRDINTQHIYDVIGEITLRYSLTFDNLYSFENNHYGTSIINCARIMSKDKLNRFLIDENTRKWFNHNFNGVETLLNFNIDEDASFIPIFNSENPEEIKSLIFNKKQKFNNIDLLKIGEISSKSDIISIHNLYCQISVTSPKSTFKKFNISIGNLNTTGLIEN